MEKDSTYDIINKKYNELKKKKSPLDKEIDNIKEQIEKTHDKYKLAKTRKVTKLNGDLFHDSGAVIIPGVYDALQKDVKDIDASKKNLINKAKVIPNDVHRAKWNFLMDPETRKTIINEDWHETGKEMLKNILTAICVYYSEIKLTDVCYVQGMHDIGLRVLYLHSFNKNNGFDKDKEEECFWILNILLNSTKSYINSFAGMGGSFRVPVIKLATLFTIILNKYITFSYNSLIGPDDDPNDPLTHRFIQGTTFGLQAMGDQGNPLNPLIGWDGPYKNESIIHGWTSSIHLQISYIIYTLQSSAWKEFIEICKHITTLANFSDDPKYIKWFQKWKGDPDDPNKNIFDGIIRLRLLGMADAYNIDINDPGAEFPQIVEFFQQNILSVNRPGGSIWYDKLLDDDEFKKIYSKSIHRFFKTKNVRLSGRN